LQSLVYLPVLADCGEYALPLVRAGIEDHAAVRRETGALVQLSLGQHTHLPGREILHRDVITGTVVVNHRHLSAVRRDISGGVVLAFIGQPFRITPGHRHTIKLRLTAAIGGEDEVLSVRGPHWFRIDARIVG
jgi:hypothetical protein